MSSKTVEHAIRAAPLGVGREVPARGQGPLEQPHRPRERKYDGPQLDQVWQAPAGHRLGRAVEHRGVHGVARDDVPPGSPATLQAREDRLRHGPDVDVWIRPDGYNGNRPRRTQRSLSLCSPR